MKEASLSSTTLVDMSAVQENSEVNINCTVHSNNNNNEEDNTSNIRGKNKTIKMMLLTQCFAGLQFTWSVELAYGTPYLLSLGLSKSLVSLVWLAGPLSGLVMQPIVGLLSDNSTSRFGRRRPFLLAGGFAVVACFFCIGWTKEIISIFVSDESPMTASLAKWLAVISFYVLDFAINCVQASCRVLIVDILPQSEQEEGTAWASRMIGIGNVFGYFMGFANLVEIFPFLGKTQMQVLCALASIIILASDLLTCWAVKEEVYTGSTNRSKGVLSAIYETLSSIIESFRNLPNYVQLICNVQFFAWIGWFPFLFYSTTWVAEVHARSTIDSSDIPSDDSVGDSTRAGSFSLLLYSIVSLGASFILPMLVKFAGKSTTNTTSSKFLRRQLSKFPMTFLTVQKLWTISHFIFAFSMISTWFVTNNLQASILISLCGISWTVTMWAPYSILGEFISKESNGGKNSDYNLVETENNLDGDDNNNLGNNEVDPENLRVLGRNSNEEVVSEIPLMDSHSGDTSTNNYSSEAGVLLGIHNMYIVLPEFLVTFFNSIVFAILEPGVDRNLVTRQRQHHANPDRNLNADAIGFILRFGGFMTIIAGVLSMKLWNRYK